MGNMQHTIACWSTCLKLRGDGQKNARLMLGNPGCIAPSSGGSGSTAVGSLFRSKLETGSSIHRMTLSPKSGRCFFCPLVWPLLLKGTVLYKKSKINYTAVLRLRHAGRVVSVSYQKWKITETRNMQMPNESTWTTAVSVMENKVSSERSWIMIFSVNPIINYFALEKMCIAIDWRKQLIPHARFRFHFGGRKVNWNQTSHVRTSFVRHVSKKLSQGVTASVYAPS